MAEPKTYPHAVDTPDLPDDPADCCRAILDALKGVDGYAIREAAAFCLGHGNQAGCCGSHYQQLREHEGKAGICDFRAGRRPGHERRFHVSEIRCTFSFSDREERPILRVMVALDRDREATYVQLERRAQDRAIAVLREHCLA